MLDLFLRPDEAHLKVQYRYDSSRYVVVVIDRDISTPENYSRIVTIKGHLNTIKYNFRIAFLISVLNNFDLIEYIDVSHMWNIKLLG